MLGAMAPADRSKSTLTILFVLGSPQRRSSTDQLLGSLRAIHRWSKNNQVVVKTHVWYLRTKPEQKPWPHAFVVDALRTNVFARALEAVNLGRVAAGFRGRLLAARWNRVAPDIVVFDDGVGDRIIPKGVHPVVVDRVNRDRGEFVEWEPPEQHRRSLIWATAGADASVSNDDPPLVWQPDPDTLFDVARSMRSPDARASNRRRLGVDGSLPLVVGWGRDSWSDAPELMMRMLWSLEHRHGIVAGGLWLGPGLDERTVRTLLADADRAGLGGRLTISMADGTCERSCGDAIFLPHRSPDVGVNLVPPAIAGCRSVVFWPEYVDPSIATLVDVVAPLDVEAAAAAVAESLSEPRANVIAAAAAADFDGWFEKLVALVER